jgi:hypothetical protein
MPDSLTSLEQHRVQILGEMAALGDFRSGSITAIRGRCGKANCQCRRPQHPGHGPHWRLTRKVSGKTVTETFPTSAARKKAQREVAAYHRFRQLSQQLLELNEKICLLRPVEQQPAPQEKKRLSRSSKKSPKR